MTRIYDLGYDFRYVRDVFELHASMGIPVEKTVSALAKTYGADEVKLQQAIKESRGTWYRRNNARSLVEMVIDQLATSIVHSEPFQGENNILMPQADTYALGVHALQEACVAENNSHQPIVEIDGRRIYRPNTFFENCLVRMEDFNTLANPDGTPRTMEERLRYFSTWLDSCCGIAYQAKTTKLKLSLVCPQLIGIDTDFAEGPMSVDYANFFHQVELDSSSPNFVRDGWMALLEGDSKVYKKYVSVLKAAKGAEIIPNFWVQQNIAKDQLRAVYVSNLVNFSYAYGNYFLNYSGRFLRRSP